MKNGTVQLADLEEPKTKKDRHHKYVFIIEPLNIKIKFKVSRKTFYDTQSNYPRMIKKIRQAYYN